MKLTDGTLDKMEEDLAASKNRFETSKIEVEELTSKVGSVDTPEMKKLNDERATLESERNNLASSTTFELRITALQMMASEAITITENQGDELLGDGSSTKISKNLILSNLNDVSTPDVRSLIKGEIDNGILSSIDATTKWVSETVENQLQQTRRIFNDVGTSIFTTLSTSSTLISQSR